MLGTSAAFGHPMTLRTAACSVTSRTVRVHVGRAYSDFASAMPTIARMG